MIAHDTDTDGLAARIAEARSRIDAACRRAGRDPAEVTLIGVTKTFPAGIVAAALRAGLADFGENRVQELDEKVAAVPGRLAGAAATWHLIGSLQRNKARRAVEIADVFHALDSERLAAELDRRLADVGRVLPCFVQVNVSGEASKSGIAPEDLAALLDALAPYERLRVEGLMTLAAPADDPEEVRPQFRVLRELRDRHADRGLRYLSMGMSGDFEVAVEEGATHVRLGTLLFGSR